MPTTSSRFPARRPLPHSRAFELRTGSIYFITLCLIAQVHNWWNIFTRLVPPDTNREAVTSLLFLLHVGGMLVSTAAARAYAVTWSTP